MFSCFRNPVVAHKIGRKIQAINQKLEDIARRSSRFGFITQAINSSSDPINKASNSLSEKTGSVINQSDVVGERIEEDTKKIVDLLIKKADTPVVPKGKNDVVVAVAITGTGGIGKTTLARMVFCDRRIEENFEKRVWLSVNQEFNEINVLQDVLASFGAKYEGFAGNNCKDLLERALKDMIRQKKFLLVMDDVWSEKVVLDESDEDDVEALKDIVKIQAARSWRGEVRTRTLSFVHGGSVQSNGELVRANPSVGDHGFSPQMVVGGSVPLGGDGEIEDDISEEEHQRTEEDYACCTQLPNGLGQLPFLDRLSVERAPSIQCIGHDFLFPSLGSEADGDVKGEAPGLAGTRNNRRQSNHISRGSGVAFPKLRALTFEGMPGWTEWDWEHRAPAMPVIEVILINNCKLQRLPAGLAHHACRLRELDLRNMQHLVSVENFPSLVKLLAYDNPRLERISNNPSLQWIDISNCRELKEFDGLPSLRSMEWWDWDAEALPQYLQETNLKKLRVDCSRSLLKLIAQQDESSEWGKIKHVQQLKAYGHKTKNEEEEPDQSSQEDEEANEEEGNQPEVDEVNEDANQAKEEEDADEDKANQSEEDEADEENDQSEEDKEDGWYIYYTKEPYSFDVYLGESTGNFIFHLLSGFINVNLQVT
nr:unnamed protein product [Digitaria exilis]